MAKLGLFVVILSALTSTACGKFGAADVDPWANGAKSVKPYGTCDRKDVATVNLCSEAVGPDYNEQGYLDILKSSCESTGGVFSQNNCERAGSVGTCIVEPGKTNETHVTYYPPEYTAASAQSACATNGGIYFAN